MLLSEYFHFVKGLDPIADAFAGTVRSDVVNMRIHHHATFIIYKAVGTTGTSTVSVVANDDVVPTNDTAIPFRSRANTTDDTWSAWTDRLAAGFDTTAGSSQLYEISVDAKELGDTGYKYVSLKMVEVVDSPVLGGILIILGPSRYPQNVPLTVIT